jgi:hypothetical protein
MANFITGREIVMAAKKATTWGTAVLCGASDGVLITDGFSGAKAPNFITDDSLGQMEIKEILRTTENIQDSVSGNLRYQGWDVLLALALGSASSPTLLGSGAYSNVYSPASSIADYFATLAMKKSPNANGLWEIPSAQLTGFEITAKVGELAKIKFDYMGNKIETDELDAVNSPVTMNSVTYPTTSNVTRLDTSSKMRMNAQAGAGLADSDKIYPLGFSLKYSRPFEACYEIGSNNMRQPVQSGFSEAILTMNFDKYNMDTFMNALDAETQYKMDILFQGNLIGGTYYYQLRIDIPKIIFTTADAPIGGPGKIPHNVTGRCLGVDAAPTGMSGVTTPISLYVQNTRTTNPLT